MNFLYRLFDMKQKDVDLMEEWIFDSNIDELDLIEYIRDQIEKFESFTWKIDIKLFVFEYIIINAGVSELIDDIYYDDKTNSLLFNIPNSKIETILGNVPVEDRNDAWLFLVEYFGINIKLEDEI